MKRLSDEEKKQIKELRERGLSFREIEKQLGVSYGACFYHSRGVEKHQPRVQIHIENMSDKDKAELEKRTSKMVEVIGGKGSTVFEIDKTQLALVHLPYVIVCSECGAEESHVYLCCECGDPLCVKCFGDIDLKTAQRKEEPSLV